MTGNVVFCHPFIKGMETQWSVAVAQQ